ncbi:MAG: TonB-dependent receptor [Thermodesulfobacteriota bacterium]
MNKGLLLILMGMLLLTLGAAPVRGTEKEGAAPDKEATPAAQESSSATQEAATPKKEATPKAKEQALPEVVVETQRLVEKKDKVTIKSEGLPAEVNVITKEDIEKMPVRNYTDMFRQVPGVKVTKYDRGDLGDSIAFRGFSSGHSGQVAYFIDGVPMYLVEGWSNTGWTDIGWLIPEMIERIEVIKGPFSALYGDAALAGVINIITKKSDSSPSLTARGGSYNTWQGVGVLSDPSWTPTPFLVWEGFNRDGYRANADYQRGQLFNKLTMPVLQGDLSLRLHHVARRWGDPCNLLVSEVQAGRDPRDAANPTDRGDFELSDVVVNYSPKGGEGGFYGTLYFNHLTWTRGSTFRPSPQDRYDDRRNYYGWKLMYNFQPFEQLSLIAGNDLRYDDIFIRRMYTQNRYQVLSVIWDYHIRQLNTAFFAQGQYKPFPFIKLVGGLRYDLFNIDVDNKIIPANSGVGTPSIFSPKVGIIVTPYKDINFFANRGEGFRSPGASEMSPYTTTGKKDFGLDVPKVDTWDVGVNALLFDRVYFSFAYFNTFLQGEIVLDNATGLYKNMGDSVRTGFEIEAKLFVTKELTIFGTFGDVRARLKNPQTPGAYYITSISPDTSTVGFDFQRSWGKDSQKSWVKENRVGVNFNYVRYARAPVTADGTKIRPQFDQFLSKFLYGWRNWTASVDVIFTPRDFSTESMGWSTAYNTYTYYPKPRWDVLAGLRYQFY